MRTGVLANLADLLFDQSSAECRFSSSLDSSSVTFLKACLHPEYGKRATAKELLSSEFFSGMPNSSLTALRRRLQQENEKQVRRCGDEALAAAARSLKDAGVDVAAALEAAGLMMRRPAPPLQPRTFASGRRLHRDASSSSLFECSYKTLDPGCASAIQTDDLDGGYIGSSILDEWSVDDNDVAGSSERTSGSSAGRQRSSGGSSMENLPVGHRRAGSCSSGGRSPIFSLPAAQGALASDDVIADTSCQQFLPGASSRIRSSSCSRVLHARSSDFLSRCGHPGSSEAAASTETCRTRTSLDVQRSQSVSHQRMGSSSAQNSRICSPDRRKTLNGIAFPSDVRASASFTGNRGVLASRGQISIIDPISRQSGPFRSSQDEASSGRRWPSMTGSSEAAASRINELSQKQQQQQQQQQLPSRELLPTISLQRQCAQGTPQAPTAAASTVPAMIGTPHSSSSSSFYGDSSPRSPSRSQVKSAPVNRSTTDFSSAVPLQGARHRSANGRNPSRLARVSFRESVEAALKLNAMQEATSSVNMATDGDVTSAIPMLAKPPPLPAASSSRFSRSSSIGGASRVPHASSVSHHGLLSSPSRGSSSNGSFEAALGLRYSSGALTASPPPSGAPSPERRRVLDAQESPSLVGDSPAASLVPDDDKEFQEFLVTQLCDD